MDSSHKLKINQSECIFYLVYTISSFLLLLLTINHSLSNDCRHSINKDLIDHLQLQKHNVSSFLIDKNLTKHPKIQTEMSNLTNLTFHPLIAPTIPPYTHPNKTWFMSTLSGGARRGLSEHFLLPSPPPSVHPLHFPPQQVLRSSVICPAWPHHPPPRPHLHHRQLLRL